jgi:xeroderma pigmentosum group C-complementing protein
MREGRRVREGEQPLKLVKQRAVTLQRRRVMELAQLEGQEPAQQGLYARWQTELVVPPPVVDVRQRLSS